MFEIIPLRQIHYGFAMFVTTVDELEMSVDGVQPFRSGCIQRNQFRRGLLLQHIKRQFQHFHMHDFTAANALMWCIPILIHYDMPD